MTSPVRMREVARAVGCSVMTVSLALRNSHEVSETTRERVRRIADELGYAPHPLVSALMAHRRRPGGAGAEVVAVVTKSETPMGLRTRKGDFHSELWSGIQERADELGFRVEEFPGSGRPDAAGGRLTRRLSVRGIRGVILFPGGEVERPYAELDWRRFVTVGATFHDPRLTVHRIASDHVQAMETALDQAARRGYRRPGLAVSPTSDPRIRYAFSGRFLAWQQGLPPALRLPIVSGGPSTADRAPFLRWFRRHRPDVILSTEAAPHGWLREGGAAVPGETGFIHLVRRGPGTLAGIDLQTRNVGRATFSVLVRELYFNRAGLPPVSEVTLVAGSWMDGDTVRTAPR